MSMKYLLILSLLLVGCESKYEYYERANKCNDLEKSQKNVEKTIDKYNIEIELSNNAKLDKLSQEIFSLKYSVRYLLQVNYWLTYDTMKNQYKCDEFNYNP